MIPLEYFAGILDVSGALTITKLRDSGGPRVMILIQQSDPVVPGLFAEAFGGKVTFTNVGEARKRWQWCKQGRPAQEVLRLLRPHMHARVRDVERLLSVSVGTRGGKRVRINKEKSIGSELTGIRVCRDIVA